LTDNSGEAKNATHNWLPGSLLNPNFSLVGLEPGQGLQCPNKVSLDAHNSGTLAGFNQVNDDELAYAA
jgi:hypothetical protein